MCLVQSVDGFKFQLLSLMLHALTPKPTNKFTKLFYLNFQCMEKAMLIKTLNKIMTVVKLLKHFFSFKSPFN